MTGEDGKTTRAAELARVLLSKALEGDIAAIKLVFDRAEGPPRQAIELSDNRPSPEAGDTVRERFVQRIEALAARRTGDAGDMAERVVP